MQTLLFQAKVNKDLTELEIESLKKTLSKFGLDLDYLKYLQNLNQDKYSNFDPKTEKQKNLSFLNHIHNLQVEKEKSLNQEEIDNLSN